ncbi:hypothetical protein [Dongshaea marina]|uniref:hypothetical protein n=1 Tax=Dongshaea marina TaxID=2047966 RepID=UPI000D3EA32D|nr:hypothetical protein [Dongshaea marina]
MIDYAQVFLDREQLTKACESLTVSELERALQNYTQILEERRQLPTHPLRLDALAGALAHCRRLLDEMRSP